MTATETIAALWRAGHDPRVDAHGRLRLRLAGSLTPELAAAVAVDHAAIVALLSVPPWELFAPGPDAGDACPAGHTPLSRGGLACERCWDCRCVGCGAWLGKPAGAFCAACRAAARDAGAGEAGA